MPNPSRDPESCRSFTQRRTVEFETLQPDRIRKVRLESRRSRGSNGAAATEWAILLHHQSFKFSDLNPECYRARLFKNGTLTSTVQHHFSRQGNGKIAHLPSYKLAPRWEKNLALRKGLAARHPMYGLLQQKWD